MLYRLIPYRGHDELTWTDKALTAVRFVALLFLFVLGGLLGWHVLGPAWFSSSTPGRILGCVVGALLGALLMAIIDAASWTSGQHQEEWDNARDLARQRRDQAMPRPVRPAPENLANVPKRPGATKKATAAVKKATGQNGGAWATGPSPIPQRPGPAGDPIGAGDAVPGDPDQAVKAARAARTSRWEPSAALVGAVVRVVRETGPRGATHEDIADGLVMEEQHPTREQLAATLTDLTAAGGALTRVQDGMPSFAQRFFDPDQVRVTRELVEQVAKAIEAGSGLVDIPGIRDNLRSMGVEPSAPALERALRVLVRQGGAVEVDGAYARGVR